MLINATNRRPAELRNGFTLIELLVVITVMVTLGGMLTYALASAETDARIKRTQADVLTMGQLLQTRMSEVSLSQVELIYDDDVPVKIPGQVVTMGGVPATPVSIDTFNARERARLILAARRDLLRMVVPECQADVLYPPASLQYRIAVNTTQGYANVAQLRPPEQWNRIRTLAGLYSAATLDSRVAGSSPSTDPEVDGMALAYNSGWQDPFNRFAQDYQPPTGSPIPDTIFDDPGIPNTEDRIWTRENESSECLYLILATTDLFGQKAIDQIQSSRIDDTDGDGFMEIIDAWGTPVELIRNPSGLRTPVIKNTDADYFNANASPDTNPLSYPLDPDPFDFLLADWRYDDAIYSSAPPAPSQAYRPYFLPPAIISAGRDREFGIRRTYWLDRQGNARGVKDFYSASAVIIPATSTAAAPRDVPDVPSPRFSSPTTGGNPMLFRMPDPFIDVSLFPFNGSHTAHDYSLTDVRRAREGLGLGGVIKPGDPDVETYDPDFRRFTADNISSLDGDF